MYQYCASCNNEISPSNRCICSKEQVNDAESSISTYEYYSTGTTNFKKIGMIVFICVLFLELMFFLTDEKPAKKDVLGVNGQQLTWADLGGDYSSNGIYQAEHAQEFWAEKWKYIFVGTTVIGLLTVLLLPNRRR